MFSGESACSCFDVAMYQSEHGHEGICTGQPCKLISDSMSPSTTRRQDRDKTLKLYGSRDLGF